jgi:hypothetical protein
MPSPPAGGGGNRQLRHICNARLVCFSWFIILAGCVLVVVVVKAYRLEPQAHRIARLAHPLH